MGHGACGDKGLWTMAATVTADMYSYQVPVYYYAVRAHGTCALGARFIFYQVVSCS